MIDGFGWLQLRLMDLICWYKGQLRLTNFTSYFSGNYRIFISVLESV